MSAPRVIDRDTIYSISELQARFGWCDKTLRRMRDEGLEVRYYGRMGFIRGCDLQHHIWEHGKDSR